MPRLFDDMLNSELASVYEGHEKSSSDEVQQTIEASIESLKQAVVEEMRADSGAMLLNQRSKDRGFRKRNKLRWGKAIDLLETIYVISLEAGDNFGKEFQTDERKLSPDRFFAIRHLHARSLLVLREIICLVEGGYPDGALSRWRTLHELAVTATFLFQEPPETSLRYRLSFNFKALAAAKQLTKYSARANIKGFSTAEIEELESICRANAAAHGLDMYLEYGWASKAIGHSRVTFAQIEERVGLDHWRPRYRWASQHTHSGFRPERSVLGLAETSEEMLLAGQSNSGMVDPLQMAAMTMNVVNSSFLLQEATVDHLVIISILDDIADKIGHTALELEKNSFAAHEAAKESRFSMSSEFTIEFSEDWKSIR